MNHREMKRVSVVGAGSCDVETAKKARLLGRLLAEAGFMVVCGGLGGVMREVCAGAKETGGMTMGIVPDTDRETANAFVDFPVATGLGIMRNALVVGNGDIVVALEGETGTLSEIAMAQKMGKTVIAVGRWSGLEGVIPADGPEQALALAKAHMP